MRTPIERKEGNEVGEGTEAWYRFMKTTDYAKYVEIAGRNNHSTLYQAFLAGYYLQTEYHEDI